MTKCMQTISNQDSFATWHLKTLQSWLATQPFNHKGSMYPINHWTFLPTTKSINHTTHTQDITTVTNLTAIARPSLTYSKSSRFVNKEHSQLKCLLTETYPWWELSILSILLLKIYTHISSSVKSNRVQPSIHNRTLYS